MKRSSLFLLILILFLFNLTPLGANTVCGFVNNSENFSASWTNVLIYYAEKPNNALNCKINPENKFCCALEDIKAVNWQKGKLVYAEVYEKDLGYVEGPVSLITSEEGYQVFPEMQIKKAITINSPIKKILINESKFFFNVSLADNYNNLKYSINSSENFYQGIICENCKNHEFYLNLSKGKNIINLTAYDKREISEKIEVYYLDYFNIQDSFECSKCITKYNKILVPSNSLVNLKISFNSSHPVSGDLLTYFPLDWRIQNYSSIEDSSETHYLIREPISGDFGEITYSFNTPKVILNRNYFFKYEFFDFSITREITTYRFFRFLPFHSSKKFSNIIYLQKYLKQKISPTEPLVLTTKETPLELVAIYPKMKLNGIFAYIDMDVPKKINKKGYSFEIITNLPSYKLENILFRFKSPKDKTLEFYDSSKKIPLEIYNEDENYYYFEANYPKKGDFKIILK